MYTRTVTMCKARHLRNYTAQEVGYNVDFTFDYDADEVRATFTCSDDFADPNICHNAEDLEEYIIRRYGAFLIKENLSTPKNFSMDMKKIAEVLDNPAVERQGTHKDSYDDEYTLLLQKPQWDQLRIDCPGIKPTGVSIDDSYKPDRRIVRMGIWHG